MNTGMLTSGQRSSAGAFTTIGAGRSGRLVTRFPHGGRIIGLVPQSVIVSDGSMIGQPVTRFWCVT